MKNYKIDIWIYFCIFFYVNLWLKCFIIVEGDVILLVVYYEENKVWNFK